MVVALRPMEKTQFSFRLDVNLQQELREEAVLLRRERGNRVTVQEIATEAIMEWLNKRKQNTSNG